MSQAKRIASISVFGPATAAVNHALTDVLPKNDNGAAVTLPKTSSLARTAIRFRSKTRPIHPTSLDFDMVVEDVPAELVRADVQHGNTRHLIFAFDQQLELLSLAKTWYADGSFRVVKEPFAQLFSIHAFVKKEGELKQMPLVMVVMSRRKRIDYIRVLEAIKSVLSRRPIVQSVVAEFE